MGPSLLWSTRIPGLAAAGGTGSSDDPGDCRLPSAVQLSAGRGAGAVLWIPSAPAPTAAGTGGRAVSAGGRLGLALSELWDLRRGSAAGIFSWAFGRRTSLGTHRREGSAPGFFRILGRPGKGRASRGPAFKKIFAFCKNFVCIWGKMGYNKVESLLAPTAKEFKRDPWKKDPIP